MEEPNQAAYPQPDDVTETSDIKDPLDKRKRRLHNLGKWVIMPLYSIGTGVITAVAVSGLAFVASLASPLFITILVAVFLSETLLHVYLLKDSVPETLIKLFSSNVFEELSRPKQILLGLGIISALGGGLAVGSLTYVSGVTAITSVLGLLGLSCPPVGIVIAAILGLVGFIAVSAMFFKWIYVAIQEDIHIKIKDFFVALFTRDPNKLLAEQILEGFFKLLFISLIVTLAFVGTIAALGTMHKGLYAFLSLIPQANLLACKISSGIIAYALMGMCRLSLVFRSVCVVFNKLGEIVGHAIFRMGLFIAVSLDLYSPPPGEVKKNEEAVKKDEHEMTIKERVLFIGECFVKCLASLCHGFSFGALAQSGGGEVISEVMDLDATTGGVIAMTSAGTTSVAFGVHSFWQSSPSIPTGVDEINEIPLNTISQNKEKPT